MRTWTTRTEEKAEWGEGPWNHEPDRVHWVSPATSLDCLMLRADLGHWCGYVGLPRDHPLWGVGYDDVDVQVHGCLTFSDRARERWTEESDLDLDPDLWWFGFDCAHLGDLVPGVLAVERRLGFGPPPDSFVYRGPEYVGAETENLARQLMELADSSE